MTFIQQQFPPLEEGSLIDGYRVLQVLATPSPVHEYLVCEAADENSRFLLKEGPEDSFADEQKLVSLSLSHPHLLALLRIFTTSDRAYLLTEQFSGQELDELERPLKAELALRIAIQVCEALLYLHERNVAHLSVRPDSILINNDQQVKLLLSNRSTFVLPGDDSAPQLFARDALYISNILAFLLQGSAGSATVQSTTPSVGMILDRVASQLYHNVTEVLEDCQQALGMYNRPQSSYQIIAAALSNLGRVRTNNEDNLGSLILTVPDHRNRLTQVGLFIVADGMGGEASGEVASQLGVRAVVSRVLRDLLLPNYSLAPDVDLPKTNHLDSVLSPQGDGVPRFSPRDTLLGALHAANAQVNALSQDLGKNSGSTCTTLLLLNGWAYIAHVGDSRLYYISEGRWEQVTEDHSLVGRLVRLGQLHPDEVRDHPHRNIIYRSLGESGQIEIDSRAITPKVGDTFVLCTDGLWDMVEPARLQELLLSSLPPAELAQQLIQAANEGGGTDNITVIVVRLQVERASQSE